MGSALVALAKYFKIVELYQLSSRFCISAMLKNKNKTVLQYQKPPPSNKLSKTPFSPQNNNLILLSPYNL